MQWNNQGLQNSISISSSLSYPVYPKGKSDLNIHWKDWCWRWNSNTLATWCKELIHLKRPWCWERLKAGGEGDDRRWDGWMAPLTWWTWVWVNSGSGRWTGRPGVLQSLGLPRVRHNWVTELNWHLKQLEKEEMKNPRVSRRKEIFKIRAEINAKEKRP